MGYDVRVSDAPRPERNEQPWRATAKEETGRGGRSVEASPDRVSLSRLSNVLRSPEMIRRVELLRLEVVRSAYSVPALEVGRRIIDDHLLPA